MWIRQLGHFNITTIVSNLLKLQPVKSKHITQRVWEWTFDIHSLRTLKTQCGYDTWAILTSQLSYQTFLKLQLEYQTRPLG